MKIFIPLTDTLSDGLIEKLGLTLDDLVPFDLDYEVLRPEQAPALDESIHTGTPEPA